MEICSHCTQSGHMFSAVFFYTSSQDEIDYVNTICLLRLHFDLYSVSFVSASTPEPDHYVFQSLTLPWDHRLGLLRLHGRD